VGGWGGGVGGEGGGMSSPCQPMPQSLITHARRMPGFPCQRMAK
jgi:hypothetical protein